MVRLSKPELLKHFMPQDYDDVSDLILSKASPRFLDKGLARRLETIDARSLVNALARAERLGYDVQDIIEKGPNDRSEHVIPSTTSVQQSTNNAQFNNHVDNNKQKQSTPSQTVVGQPAGPSTTMLKPSFPQTPGTPNATPDPALFLCLCRSCERPCSSPEALRFVGFFLLMGWT
jgi:hypothetical protein